MKVFQAKRANKLLVFLLALICFSSSYGQVQTLVSHNFLSQCSLPSGWTIANVDGGCTWRCSSGFVQNNHYSQSCSGAANDWLILPQIDFANYINEQFQLYVLKAYNGPNLVLRFSSDYPGTGNPMNYTWTQIQSFSGSFNSTINISSLNQEGYLAFQYTSNSNATNQAARWTIRTVGVTGEIALDIDNLKINQTATTTADVEAEVVTTGGQTVTDRGFIWSTNPNITLNSVGVNKVSVSGGLGSYSTTLSSLPSGSKIYLRGFVSTAGLTRYTGEQSFYTLSDEPTSYPGTFTANTISKNSIDLEWNKVNDANGYLIIRKAYSASSGIPEDATAYSVNSILDDGEIVAILNDPNDTTVTINNLIQGTRHYFTLFPYSSDGTNYQTNNYRTAPVIPVANDSTWGNPPSPYTIIEPVIGSEASLISSLLNESLSDSSKGMEIWRLKLVDGGAINMNDSDDLPSILTEITLNEGTQNTVSNWQNYISEAVLIDDSTDQILAVGTIGTNSIQFNSFTLEAADDNFHSFRVKISLVKTAQIDHSIIHLALDQSAIQLKEPLLGSQAAPFAISSDSTKNEIEVIATDLRFDNHPASKVEAGKELTNAIQVAAIDTFGGIDLDFTGTIQLDASASNLIASPRMGAAQNGIALFDTIRFNQAALYDTLLASSGSLRATRGNQFEVEVSDKSDFIVDGSFAYPENIVHTNFLDSGFISTSNSIEVFRIWLRDGGANGDYDFEKTELNDLVLDITNPSLIARIGLFAGNTLLSESNTIVPSGSNNLVYFNGLDTSALDNDSIQLNVRVAFNPQILDGSQFEIELFNVVANDSFSQFASANGGGAKSSKLGNRNRIDIQAQSLEFIDQPTNVYLGAIQKPEVRVVAKDILGNLDVSGRAVTLSVQQSGFSFGATSTVALSSVNQGAKFGNLIYNTAASHAYLVAYSNNLDSAVSDSFEVIIPVWYRSVSSGNWSDISNWETSTDFGANWSPAAVEPNYSIHGIITIQSGDTIYMDGTTTEANTVDELLIEAGAVLHTPKTVGTYLTVNNAGGNDIEVFGKIVHDNSSSISGLFTKPNASILVKKAGAIELKGYGDAINWAGNSQVQFEDSSFYIHSTTLANTIGKGIYFPNTPVNAVPVFLVNANQTIAPNSNQGAGFQIEINGLLMLAANRQLEIDAAGTHSIRNGVYTQGNLKITEGTVSVTGLAILGGNGRIDINGASSELRIAQGSNTLLSTNLNMMESSSNGFHVFGVLDAQANALTGNTSFTLEDNSTLITAHSNGLDGNIQVTGNVNLTNKASYHFNGSTAQITGSIHSGFAKNLIVENASGLTLSQGVMVSDSLKFIEGVIISDTANTLSVENSISNYDQNKYVSGPLKRWINAMQVVEFPIGKNGAYGQVNYRSNSNTSAWIQLEYFDQNPQLASLDTSKKGLGIASIRANEFWNIERTQSIEGAVEIPYTSLSNIGGIDQKDIRVISFDGTEWNKEGPAKRNATLSEVASDLLNNYAYFTIGIDSSCNIPLNPIVTPTYVCSGGDALLSAISSNDLFWFTDTLSSNPYAIGNNVPWSGVSSDTVIYVESHEIGCASDRVSLSFTLQNTPSAPAYSGKTSLCFGESAVLTVPSFNQVNWYDTDTSLNAIALGSNFQTAPLYGDTSYFVETVQNGCRSLQTEIQIQVRSQLLSPNSETVEVCEGSPVSVQASSNFGIKWYLNLLDTQEFANTPSLNIPNLSQDTVFYIEAEDGACISPRIPLFVKFLNKPVKPILSDVQICKGSQAILEGIGQNIAWYNDSSSTIAIATGSTFTTPILGNNRIYYATSSDGKCYSEKEKLTVEVFNTPSAINIAAVQYTPANQLIQIQTDAVADNYVWDFGDGSFPQSAIGKGPHNVYWTSKGSKQVHLQIWNGSQLVQCGLSDSVEINVQSGLSVGQASATKISMYPNPVSRSLYIDAAYSTPYQVRIVSIDGKEVYANSAYTNGSAINTESLLSGVYIVEVFLNGELTSLKLVK